ncbi:MAG TPA: POTRA domain-containing protein [Blastocatellia bacterium]|nr:POTRA domain-containing protein [Blastocatellia bacterium]
MIHSFIPQLKKSLFLILSILIASLTAAIAQAQSQPPAGLKLGKVEFNGLKRYTEAQAVAATGLETGQNMDLAAIDAAMQRMLKTGLFRKINYYYTFSTELMNVRFEIEEERWIVPCVFDNFVWFTDQEILTAVSHDVPTFDGTAPAAGAVIDSIRKSLERLLQERKISGQIEYAQSPGEAGTSRHIFSVRGLNLSICKLSFPGAAAVPESRLLENSKLLFNGGAYSRSYMMTIVHANLIPLYLQLGHLRAGFGPPQTALSADGGRCKQGVAVTMPVDEGVVYMWDKAEWSGNNLIPTPALENTLGMKSGEVADGLKFNSGVQSVAKAYLKQGYIEAKFNATPTFDETNRRVSYSISISEGQQYRMGGLTIEGVKVGEAQKILGKWKLKRDEIYDALYLKEFIEKELPKLLSGPGRFFEPRITPDRQALTVDVKIIVR